MRKVEKLELAIDAQLEEIRKEMFEGWAKGSDNLEFVASLVRAAYGRGLTDAILYRSEVIEWARDLGFNLTNIKQLKEPSGFPR